MSIQDLIFYQATKHRNETARRVALELLVELPELLMPVPFEPTAPAPNGRLTKRDMDIKAKALGCRGPVVTPRR